ncbi:MAG TPA: O-antigen ligase family protein [Candidatus Polarisedimenticolia bacterium]|jgi:O-antigen ligase|nr:O-antigen ligase family protein [Candidatus Polarisedimenticolia bacterium]
MHALVRHPAAVSLLKPLLWVLLLAPLALFIATAPLAEPLLLGAGIALVGLTAWNIEAGLVILIASMLLSPELPLGAAGHGGLDLSRSVILRTEDVVLLLVGLGWLARMAIHKDLGAVRGTRLNAVIALYVACCLLSTLVGIGAGRVRPVAGLCFVAKYVEYFVIFFMTLNYVRTEERLRRLLAALLATAASIAAYGWWQIPKGVRPSAPFEGAQGEPNTLGGYLALMTAMALALALHAPSKHWRRGCGVLAAMAVPVIAMTLSRSSWMGLAAAVLVLLLLSPRRRVLLGASVVCAALLLLYLPAKVEQRIDYTFTPEGHDAVSLGRLHLDPSSSARLHSWGSALDGFARHPLTGYGVTGYGFLDAQYFRVLVELGAFGALAFGALLFGCGRLFFEVWRDAADPLHRALGLGLLSGFAALLVHAIGTNTFLLIRIMEPFWMLCALAAAARGLPSTAPAPETVPAATLRPLRLA